MEPYMLIFFKPYQLLTGFQIIFKAVLVYIFMIDKWNYYFALYQNLMLVDLRFLTLLIIYCYNLQFFSYPYFTSI